jgi:hypothetical protein
MLAKKCAHNLGDFFNVKKFLVNKDICLEITLESIFDVFKINKLSLLVYISGETRDRKNMMKFNFDLPSQVSKLCDAENIPFVYLSSLSIYGIPKSNLVFSKSNKIPFNEYGATKLKLDNFIKNKLINLKFCSIAPGTIINPDSSKNNLIKNGINILSSKPLIWILGVITPNGNYACVHIDDLVKCLVKECTEIYYARNEKVYRIFKNCSTKIKIHDLVTYILRRKPILKFKNIPVCVIRILSVFFSNNFKMILIVYLADIEYINEYDFLKQRSLCDYIN